MRVTDLSREQLIELKQDFYLKEHEEGYSYSELANIDSLVSDEQVFNEYQGVNFVSGDFFCTAN